MRADWNRCLAYCDLNPVVVKELRQAVRSFFVSGVLLLFLFALLIYMLAFMAGRSADPNANRGFGGEAFLVLSGILSAASLLFVPAYTGIRIALERQDGNLDLLYTTTLSPGRIIRGKLYSGLYLALLFFSACMPFILLTIFLRGIDLLTIGTTFYHLLAVTLLMVQAAILVACLPVSLLFKALISLPALFAMTSLSTVFVRVAHVTHMGHATPLGATPFSPVFLNSIPVVLLIWGWLYVCSVGLVAPKSMNRALPIRLYSLGVWLLAGFSASYYAVKYSSLVPLQSWAVFTLFLLMVVLLFSVGQPDQLSLRVQCQIPRNRLWRFFAFFFFNGAAQGLAWCLLVTLLASPLLLAVTLSGWRPWSPTESDYTFLAVLCYGYSYGLTGLFIHRKFLPHRSPVFASAIAILIPLLFATLPALILFFINRLSWQVMESLQLGNIFNMSLSKDASRIPIHFYFALSWALLALLLNLPWFFRQVRAFHPPLTQGPGADLRRTPA